MRFDAPRAPGLAVAAVAPRFGLRLLPFVWVCVVSPLQAAAAPAATSGAAATGAATSTRVTAAPERQIAPRRRPTVVSRTEKHSREERGRRFNLQIPERLRKTLAARIELRIDDDLARSRVLRREAAALLTKFVAEIAPQSAEMPEALMRLGELEWEEGRDAFLAAFKRWERQPADTRDDPPVPNYSQARARFTRVLKQYKTFREYDLALYVDGFLAHEQGQFEESVGRFNKILEWFPKSRFVADAHMMRAEHEFLKDVPNYAFALQEYEAVLKYKNTELADIALFKSAWTLWRLGRPAEAAQRFLRVFRETSEARPGGKRQSELDALQAEALKNLVAVFVEDEKNTAEDMHRFLVQAGGDKFAHRIVSALAEALYDQSHYERGAEAYRLLIQLEPTHPEAYKYALKIAQGHSTMEAWTLLEADYRHILATYSVAPSPRSKEPVSPWAQVQTPAGIARAESALREQLKDDAIGLHAKAQADKTSRGEFEGAARLYRVYLTRFGQRADAYDIRFNLAEISFYHLDDAHGAAENYLAAVRLDPKNKHSKTALYNALAALEVLRETEFAAAKKAGKKQAETPTDKQLTEAMELYVKSYPEDQGIPELLFRQGKLYYDYAVYDPAVRQWGLLLEKYPESRFSGPAGELVLDSFNKGEDYENIETWARRLKSAPSFQSAAQQSKLNALIVGAVFKQGEQHSRQGDHDKAAAAYLRAAKEFPKEQQAPQAAVNAEVEARRAADLVTLKTAVSLLVDNYRARPEAAQGVWIAAETYQSVGLFSEAADYHAVVAESWPKFEHHADAAYNAVLLRTALGQRDKAIASGQLYKKHYPRGDGADEVTFLMGKAHEKAEKWDDAAQLYKSYADRAKNPNSRIEALVRLAGVSRSRPKDATQALDEAQRSYKQQARQLDDRGRYFAAKGQYMQAEVILEQFKAVKIEGDVSALKRRLKDKSLLLKKAADAFLRTAEMGVAEWTTASLYQIGYTYESFSKALLTSPPPPGLNAAQRELYQQSIDEFVIPIEERSLEAYETGWQKAVSLGIFNAWTAKMREALGRLNSELYPPVKEIGVAVRSRGRGPLPALIVGTRRAKDGSSRDYLIPNAADAKPAASDAKPGATASKPSAGASK